MSLIDSRTKQKTAIPLPNSTATELTGALLGFSLRDRNMRIIVNGIGGAEVVTLEASIDGTNWVSLGDTTGPGLLDGAADFNKVPFQKLRLNHAGATDGTFDVIAKTLPLTVRRR